MNLSLLLDSPVVVLLCKWTFLLALGWAAHWILSHRQARWRLILWRSVLCFSLALPILQFCKIPGINIPIRMRLAVWRCWPQFDSVNSFGDAGARPLAARDNPSCGSGKGSADSGYPKVDLLARHPACHLGHRRRLGSISTYPAATAALAPAKNLPPGSASQSAGNPNSGSP